MSKSFLSQLLILAAALAIAPVILLPVKAEIIKGPYLQNVTADGVTILWESSQPCIGIVHYGLNQDYGQSVREKEAVRIHELRLGNLAIETVYHYRVLSGADRSADCTLQTAIRPESPFRFVFYGDNRSGPQMHRRNALAISSENPNIVLQCGDLVLRGDVYSQWERLFFTPAAPMISHIPIYPALGNHEANADYYFKFLSLPGKESYYSFDYGNAHFVVLDSAFTKLEEGSEQWNWLVEDLKHSRAVWKFVSFHHPPFTSGGNYYTKQRVALKKILPPLFDTYGVDIAFHGHDHDYERSVPILSKGGVRPVTYVVCGNGGTPLRYVGKREWTAYSARVFGYALVSIHGRRLELQAKTVDGEVIDRLIIDKSDTSADQKYLAGAISLESIQDPMEAIDLWDKAKALAAEGQKKKDSAILGKAYEDYAKALHADPTFAEALVEMGRMNRLMGKESLAEEQFLKAIDLLPVYPESYRDLTDIYLQKGAYTKAFAMAERWTRVEPDQTGPEAAIARIYLRQGQTEQAILHLQKALIIVPSDTKVHEDLAEQYLKIGRKAEARAHYQEAIRWTDFENTEAIQILISKIEAIR